jgi:hypothetical protein
LAKVAAFGTVLLGADDPPLLPGIVLEFPPAAEPGVLAFTVPGKVIELFDGVCPAGVHEPHTKLTLSRAS